MAYFVHRERYISDSVPSNSIVRFPTSICVSSNPTSFRYLDAYKDMDDTEFWEKVPKSDIVYRGCTLDSSQSEDLGCGFSSFEGSFDILLPGTYIITWFVSQITGVAADSQFLCLKVFDDETNQWIPGSNSRLLVSSSECSGILHITEDDLRTLGKVSIALFNTSNTSLLMNRTSHIKAALAIYGFNVATEDLLRLIIERIEELTGNCCNNSADFLDCLRKQVASLELIDKDQTPLINQLDDDWKKFYERFKTHTISRRRNEIFSTSQQFPGLTLCYNRTGYLHVFWLEGTVNAAITRSGKQYIVTSNQCEPLRMYNRTDTSGNPFPLRGFCFRQQGTGAISWVPVFFDNTGIYLNLTGSAATIANGTRFSFSQVMILAEDM